MEKCRIVQDLIPIYRDGLTNEQTSVFVEQHTASCPKCRTLLEKMSESVGVADGIKKAEFQEPSREYALQHYVKVQSVVLLCMLLLVIAAVLCYFSLDIGISLRGLNICYTIEQTVSDITEQDTKLLLAKDADNNLVLVRANKNAIGVWTTHIIDTSKGESVPIVSASWYNQMGMHFFDPYENTYAINWNHVYCGNNATRIVKFRDGQIPENVTVRIEQQRSMYIVHVISYADPAVTNNFDVLSILRQNGCIS